VGRFFDALKAGAAAFKEGTEPSEYMVAGRPVKCAHCGERKFAEGSALLNTRARSAFNVDWADPSATILICAECGRIEWYAKEADIAPGTSAR
jgi:predicted nucleic-acid-binding Zn-ribbon protein